MTEKTADKHSFFPNISENVLRKINEEIKEVRLPSAIEELRGDNRSARAIMAERILRAVNDGHLSSAAGSYEFLQKRSAVEDAPLPAFFESVLEKDNGSIKDFHGVNIITFGQKADSSYTVLYLHGGAYTEEILPFHLNYCSHLSRRLNACVIVPLYPLAPNHIWKETYDILTALYREMLAEKQNEITIMGDSAGGGLAIAFCQFLKTIDLPQPDHLIGLSPWVDVCMTDTDYEPYRPLDPMLDVPGLQEIGKAWAGELSVRDPKISPIFGDNHGLPNTLLFAGTREILYPDICKFYEKMRADGCDVELVVAEGMNHVFPLYGLPESKEAVARIDREITGG